MQMQTDADNRHLVIGCGTGRCGTVSLTKFLDGLGDVSMIHEGVTTQHGPHHLVPWYHGQAQLWSWLGELEKMSGDTPWYGDVGFYFLPYLPDIFERYPDAHAICLERDRGQVVKSYLKKTDTRNHWYNHDGVGWEIDPEWDAMYPSYTEPDKARAIGLYWDQYHCTALEYAARFPDQFLLVPTQALNSAAGRRRILAFIGHDASAAAEGQFHFNASYRGRLKRVMARVASAFR